MIDLLNVGVLAPVSPNGCYVRELTPDDRLDKQILVMRRLNQFIHTNWFAVRVEQLGHIDFTHVPLWSDMREIRRVVQDGMAICWDPGKNRCFLSHIWFENEADAVEIGMTLCPTT